MSIVLLSLAGAVIAAVVGTIWYLPGTPMGKLHMRYLGFDQLTPGEQAARMAAAKPTMPKLYAAQMGLSLLTAFATVFIMTMSMQNGLTFIMAVAFVLFNWLCFIVPTIGGTIIWSNADRSIAVKKFFSDSLESLVTLLLIASVAGFFA